jgi:hypothetical protein
MEKGSPEETSVTTDKTHAQVLRVHSVGRWPGPSLRVTLSLES